ncbi:MAG: ribonuclease III [Vicinamibacteraceae bacterium]
MVVVFRTASDVEASLVAGLLETHGIAVRRVAEALRVVMPLPASGLGDIRLEVAEQDAAEAQRLIEAYQDSAEDRFNVVPFGDGLVLLEHRLGYRFRDRGLLEHALTHRSRAHEDVTGGVVDNESLEFLGDAVLGFVMADVIFRDFPEADEGQKSKIKASVVSTAALVQVGERLGLGQYLLLGRGEEKSGGRHKQALIADTCEAIIAGIYLDGGLDAARRFIVREFHDLLDEVKQPGLLTAMTGDYKSALQEWLQDQRHPLPAYRVVATRGPDHEKEFFVEVWSEDRLLASANGRSKKEAEQAAACRALEQLRS